MTKMQIIAKTSLIALGIYGIVSTCRHLSYLVPSTQGQILPIAGFSIFTAAIAFFFVFKNNFLTYKVAGAGEKLNAETETIWLTTSLRLGLVFCGLIVLSTCIPAIIKILLTPLRIRPTVNEIFVLRRFPASLVLSVREWCTIIFDFGKAILAIYLIYGAPRFIRWQLKYSFAHRRTNTTKPEGVSYE